MIADLITLNPDQESETTGIMTVVVDEYFRRSIKKATGEELRTKLQALINEATKSTLYVPKIVESHPGYMVITPVLP